MPAPRKKEPKMPPVTHHPAYRKLEAKQREEMYAFLHENRFFAYNDPKAFAEGMRKLGLRPTDTDQLVDVGGGAMRKDKVPEYRAIVKRHDAERAALKKQIKADWEANYKVSSKAKKPSRELYEDMIFSEGNKEFYLMWLDHVGDEPCEYAVMDMDDSQNDNAMPIGFVPCDGTEDDVMEVIKGWMNRDKKVSSNARKRPAAAKSKTSKKKAAPKKKSIAPAGKTKAKRGRL